MYQNPVGSLENIRKIRRRVKHILSDIGLEDCQTFLETLQKSRTNENADDSDEEDYFEQTEWADFSDVYIGKRRKKWPYRTRAFCCSLCHFNTRNWSAYRSHRQRNHEYEKSLCNLTPCPSCPFIASPKILKKHHMFFHSKLIPQDVETAPLQPPTTPTPAIYPPRKEERYRCRKCQFQVSVLYKMKQHVLVRHLEYLMTHFCGKKSISSNAYSCKVCKETMPTFERLIQHVLCTVEHQWVNTQVKTMIYENRNYLDSKKYKETIPNLFNPNPNQTYQLLAPKTQPNDSLAVGVGGIPAARGMLGPPEQKSGLLKIPHVANPSFLPPQATALVQLASAEAKGLLRPGATVTLQSALHQQGIPSTMPALVRAPTGSTLPSSGTPPKQVPVPTIGAPPGRVLTIPTNQQHHHQQQQQQHQQQQQQQKALPQQFILPPGVQLNLGGPGAQSLLVAQRLPLNHTTPQGTMMTSQSLLSHLIPTGNKINGMPTYTLAPLHMAMPVQPGSSQAGSKAAAPQPTNPQNTAQPLQPQPTNPQNTAQPLQPARQTANSSLYTQAAKKWITCPICNELFPENVYKIHTEVNHKAPTRTSKQQGLAARAPFLRKMPDKTVKCLMCKCLLSEKGVFEHLLHGLNCLYCPGMFYSIKQLVEHTKEHNPAHKANCDFMRREYRLYTNEQGMLLFPYFDINTTAPKEVLGDTELNLALVTNSLDLIFLKMLPNGRQEVCRMPIKTTRTDCPFCDEKCQNAEKYQQHLKQKHFIAPTVHAILKTAAFKCIYCNGVYTGNTTQKAIMIHIQRCLCAPKTQKDAEKLMPPNTNREVVYPSFSQGNQVHQPPPVLHSAPPPRPPAPAPAPATSAAPEPQTEVELQSKRRLELAWKEAMDANKREREARAVQKKKREQEKLVPAAPPPEIQIDPTVQMVLDPSGMEFRPLEERKDFLTRYFHANPYLTKRESDELSKRLILSKSELALHLGQKRTRCMRAMQKRTAAVLLGFNMAEVNKLKHDLLIPEVEPTEVEKMAETEEMDESGESERMDETAEPEESEKEDDSKETDEGEESGKNELEEMSD